MLIYFNRFEGYIEVNYYTLSNYCNGFWSCFSKGRHFWPERLNGNHIGFSGKRHFPRQRGGMKEDSCQCLF